MPYKRSYANRRLKGRKQNQRYRKGFRPVGNTNNLYRNSIPRTLQIATRRNTKQVLRFVSNQCYEVTPGGNVGGCENVFLRIRANSIYDIMHANGNLNAPTTWVAQDPTVYGPSVTLINAEGFSDWQSRYSQFTVLGSKISCTFEPYGIASGSNNAVPATVYINLAGNPSMISTGTEMSAINKLPYTKRASVVPSKTMSITSGLISSSFRGNGGVRLYHHYSAKKFEGVKDVSDNQQLKGDMLSSPSVPDEQSYFTVGLRNTIPTTAAADRMPKGIMRVKVEYITLLSEPSSTNQVQAPA